VIDQLHLLRRGVDLLAPYPQLVILHINIEAVVADLLGLFLILDPAAAQHRLDPGDNLLGLKGFYHIIVRPQLEAEHLVEHLALGGEHDDGALGFFADFAADLPAVELRHHHVEQDQIRLFGVKQFKGFHAVRRDDRVKAFLFEIQTQQFADVGVVIHHHNFAVRHGSVLLLFHPPRRPRNPNDGIGNILLYSLSDFGKLV
jgi:hypothetical protein